LHHPRCLRQCPTARPRAGAGAFNRFAAVLCHPVSASSSTVPRGGREHRAKLMGPRSGGCSPDVWRRVACVRIPAGDKFGRRSASTSGIAVRSSPPPGRSVPACARVCDRQSSPLMALARPTELAAARSRRKSAGGFLQFPYFFTTTISGLSLAALLWTTNALTFALVFSLRARWTRSAAMIPASPVFSSVVPAPSTSTTRFPSIT
jgi:hypothetical protein